jgi:hypothetical protein
VDCSALMMMKEIENLPIMRLVRALEDSPIIQSISQIENGLKRAADKSEKSAVKLGDIGWSIPILLSDSTIDTLVDSCTSDQVNDEFVAFYMDNDNAKLLELID